MCLSNFNYNVATGESKAREQEEEEEKKHRKFSLRNGDRLHTYIMALTLLSQNGKQLNRERN